MIRQQFAMQGIFTRILSVSLFIALIQLSGFGERIGHSEFDLLSTLTAPPPPEHGVIVIGLDDPSFLELNLSPPLPRRLYAQLIDALGNEKAKVVGIDLLFSEHQSPADDQRLQQALGRANQLGLEVILVSAQVQVASTQVQSYTQQLMPIYTEAQVGRVNLLADMDNVVRRISMDTQSFWYQVIEASERAYQYPPPGARLRYYAPEIPQEYVQFTQALMPEQSLPANSLQGRILLLGINTPVSGVDRFPTPFSDHEIAGVAVHATAINNALFDDWIVKQPVWQTLLITYFVLILMMLCTKEWKPGRAAVILFSSLVLLMASVIWQFYVGQWWLFWPFILGAVFLYNYDAATNYWMEWRRKEHLRALFSSYVPPTVVDKLTQQNVAPVTRGERRELTILFADLAGFTAANELMGPDEVATALNDYFSAMTQVIHAEGGTLDKFIGDAVMAFWNAPVDQPDHANRALACACKMQIAMDELRLHWSGTAFEKIRLRIGLHSGEASVGNMGSSARFTYTAVGDSVNTAARLEGANKVTGSDILLSKATVQRLKGEDVPPVAWLDRLLVAGKHQAVDVYTPVADQQLADTSHELLHSLEQGDLYSALNICQSLCILIEQHNPALLPQVERLLARLQGLQTTLYSDKNCSEQQLDFSLSIGK